MNKEKLYKSSPIWLQDFWISCYGYKLKKERYGSIYHKEIERLNTINHNNRETLKKMQNRLFLDFLHYTIKHSPFYKEFYKDVDLSQIRSVEDIDKLPILTKETLRQNIERVYTIRPEEGSKSITGGTTGKSLRVYFTYEDLQKRLAFLDWWKSLHGFVMTRDRHARFNGKDIVPLGQKQKCFWRNNRCINQRIYSSFFTSKENIPYYVENLNIYKPKEIDGFVTNIYEIAKYMDEHNIRPTFQPIAIFPTSETVLPVHRELLTKVFGCPVRDQYASSEGAPFIVEDSKGHMHECINTGVFEHIPTEKGTKLIVTAFYTHGTPLIRYDIGDDIVEADKLYVDEGELQGYPCIKAIDGRKADYLTSPERGIINLGNLSNVIKYMPNSIVNIQYIQTAEDHIDIKLVVDENRFEESQKQSILDEMAKRFGTQMTFNIHIVDYIPRAKSGKYQMIINLCRNKG